MRKRVLVRSVEGLPRMSASSESLDRRHLRLVPLAPPDYLVAPNILLNSCVEREVTFLGTLPRVNASKSFWKNK